MKTVVRRRHTTVLAEYPEDLQRALGIFKMYCEVLGVDVNLSKTEIMILLREEIINLLKFHEESSVAFLTYKNVQVKFNDNCTF